MINPIRLANIRRADVYKDGKILLSNFEGSKQQNDLDKTKGAVKGAIDQFYRVKSNIKPEPWAEFKKTGNPRELMFDFNWWPIPELGGEPEDYNEVFIYQLKGCNVACNFCFVDRFNNNGKMDHGAKYFTIEEIVDTFLQKREELNVHLNVLRASGGEPSLVPEQWLAVLQELEKRGVADEVYFQSDTNLTTGEAFSYWIKTGQLDPGILKDIAQYKNFGLLSCFKGTDPANFTENTGCRSEFYFDQFPSFAQFLNAGIPIYPHIVNPNPESLEMFMEDFTGMCGKEMWKMAHVFRLGMYGPVKSRFADPEQTAAKWADNQCWAEDFLDRNLQERFDLGYKEASRPEVLREILG